MERHRTCAATLVKERPVKEDLQALLQVDSDNTNLRFLYLVDAILSLEPEIILLTGDVTDNGFGYQLVQHYFKPWIEQRRLLVVPGNHDTNDMFPTRRRGERLAAKVNNYRRFAKAVGMAPTPSGAWFRRVEDLAVVGFNSCSQPKAPLSASGAVGKAQLEWLQKVERRRVFAGARLRLGLMHHHLLGIPFEVGRRTPLEMGLKLRNAVQVMEGLTNAKFDVIFNGHRHHGYMVKLPGRPLVLSSPSSTLGCKSSYQHYLWQMDLDARRPCPELIDL